MAPEHVDARVLEKMKKPANIDFEGFAEEFQRASRRGGKPKQYLVPYFIASHPGSDLEAMIELALFLKRHGYRPDQVQDFIPAPMDVATSMYYTGLDPRTLEPVTVAKKMRDRRFQRHCCSSSGRRTTSKCARHSAPPGAPTSLAMAATRSSPPAHCARR